jgi:ferrous iron transport protein B
VGFTIGYLVNTIGTLIVDASALHIGGAIGGGIAVALMVAIVVYLCVGAEKKLKAEYALKAEKKKEAVVSK